MDLFTAISSAPEPRQQSPPTPVEVIRDDGFARRLADAVEDREARERAAQSHADASDSARRSEDPTTGGTDHSAGSHIERRSSSGGASGDAHHGTPYASKDAHGATKSSVSPESDGTVTKAPKQSDDDQTAASVAAHSGQAERPGKVLAAVGGTASVGEKGSGAEQVSHVAKAALAADEAEPGENAPKSHQDPKRASQAEVAPALPPSGQSKRSAEFAAARETAKSRTASADGTNAPESPKTDVDDAQRSENAQSRAEHTERALFEEVSGKAQAAADSDGDGAAMKPDSAGAGDPAQVEDAPLAAGSAAGHASSKGDAGSGDDGRGGRDRRAERIARARIPGESGSGRSESAAQAPDPTAGTQGAVSGDARSSDGPVIELAVDLPQGASADVDGLTTIVRSEGAVGAGSAAGNGALSVPMSALARRLNGDLGQSIVRQAKVILQDSERGEIRLVIRPPELGRIRISLQMEQGHIAGRILVDNQSVREIVQDNLAALERAFAEAGLSLDHLDVSTGDPGRSQEHEGDDRSNRSRRRHDAFAGNVPSVVTYDYGQTHINLVA